MVRKKTKVIGRWHDNRHTLVTELAEPGAGDEVILEKLGEGGMAPSLMRLKPRRRRNSAPERVVFPNPAIRLLLSGAFWTSRPHGKRGPRLMCSM